MKIPWQKVVSGLAALYRALLKGKKVGGVTWPQEGHTIPRAPRVPPPGVGRP